MRDASLNAMRTHACILWTVLLVGCDDAPAAPGADLAHATRPEWSRLVETPELQPRWGMPLAYVASERRFIGVGGALDPDGTAVSEVWSLAMGDKSWSRYAEDALAPPARYLHCTTWLPMQNEVLVVGGRDQAGPLRPAAWTFNPTTEVWTSIRGPLPKGVVGCHAAWMPSLGRAVVWGGEGEAGPDRDTWIYDPNSVGFTRLEAERAPPGRAGGALSWDGAGRLLLFGGARGEVLLDDLWAFDGTGWTEVATEARPPARRGAATGFDPGTGTLYLFGGAGEGGGGDLWRYDVARRAWAALPQDGAPAARESAASGWDVGLGGFIVIGGLDRGRVTALSDGWIMEMR